MSLLVVDDVESGYLPVPVLAGFRLHVNAGEILAVLGPNGVGKTTLFKTMTGLLPARRGKVTFADQIWTTQGPEVRVEHGLVMVPEGRRLFRSLTVAENLRAGWLLRRGAEINAESVYQLFPRLRERADVKAGSMSGGEQQMLAVGRAVLTQPKAMLVDEPSLGLAPMTAQTVLQSFRQLAETGTAVVMAEQNLRLSLAVADRAVVMHGGQIVHDQECLSSVGRAAAEDAYREVTSLKS